MVELRKAKTEVKCSTWAPCCSCSTVDCCQCATGSSVIKLITVKKSRFTGPIPKVILTILEIYVTHPDLLAHVTNDQVTH